MDVSKAYDSLDRGWYMDILMGYCLQRFGDEQVVVPKMGRFYGRTSGTERRVTQGDLVSPTIFKILVDTVLRVVLIEICGSQEAQHWLGWEAGDHNIVLYADNGHIAGYNPIWVQTMLTVVVRMFERVGLQTNLGKTKSMLCNTGFIWG